MNLECAMSSQRLTEYATAGDDDYPAHEHTYQMFLKLLRRAMMVIAGVLILMAIFLT
jgi:Bacterial aa3 type cytochrome c oxidase subunit IV